MTYKKYHSENFEILGLDAWDGSKRQVKRFKKKSGATFPILRNASDYIEKLETVHNRGAFFILDESGRVIASCDDGYRSFDCFETARLDSTVREALDFDEKDKETDY